MPITPAGEDINQRRGIDHIGVNASAILHDGTGRILLMKRGQKARDEQGRWDACAGAIEFGETVEEALRREVKEEVGCDIIKMEFMLVRDIHRHLPDGRPTHWIAITYAAQVDPQQVINGEPHKIDELGWFEPEDLPSPLHSQLAKALDAFRERQSSL